ncbi:MAG: hypothetical protein JOZ84_16660 [Methylobacteriaceae bacterium]|nr:hypothetical protein [Methylobacteriaceae bacterium]
MLIDTETPELMSKVDPARQRRMIPPTDCMNTPEAIRHNRAIYQEWCEEKRKGACQPTRDEPNSTAERNRQPTSFTPVIDAEASQNTPRQEPRPESGAAHGDVQVSFERSGAQVEQPVAPRWSSKCSPGLSVPKPTVSFKVADGVKTLPGERSRKHKAFVERARKYYKPSSGEGAFYLTDLTYSHCQLTRYCEMKERMLYTLIKARFFEVITSKTPNLSKKPRTKFWRKRKPTDAGLEILAGAGISFEELVAHVFTENIQLIGTWDALISHQRGVRNESLARLERGK